MVHVTPIKFHPERTTLLRALSSLTRRDVDATHAALRAVGSDLAVEEHDDYDGYLSLLLTARGDVPSYLVSGRTDAVELAEVRGDDLTVIGSFAGIGAAMLALRALLTEPGAAAPTAAAATSRAVDLLERHGGDADLHAAMCADAEESWKPVLRAVDVLKRLPPS